MAQKQRLLAQAVGETREKLEALRLVGQQANEALAKGEISRSQYDALQREIAETEQALRNLERQAEQASVALQKIGAAGEKLRDVGSAIEGAGRKLMPVTAAVGGLSVAAVKMASDFDSAMSQVAAVSGATGKELDALRDKAREMGSKTKFSASEAMNYMAMAGWKTGDMLDGIEGIMNLAAASGEDLAVTSDIVTDALTALGLSVADSGHFADILAAASSNANTNVAMMGETFKYCAVHGGGHGGGYRSDGQCGHQVFPGGYGYADHADEPDGGSDFCRGCVRGADGADHQCRWEYEKPGGYPDRLPGGVCADVGI